MLTRSKTSLREPHIAIRQHKYHQYTDSNLIYDSEYNIPIIPPVNISVERLIPWKPSQKDYNGTVHFYMDDEKFSSIATYPRKYINAVKKYQSVIQPDFSHYPQWNYNVQRWSHFLRQWVGAIWTYYGQVTVIPNVHIPPDKNKQWDFYWAGLPQKSLIALSCMDASDYAKNPESQTWFLNGIKKVIEKLNPIHIIYYGGEIKKLEQEFGSLITWFNRQQFIGQKSAAKRETYNDYYKLWKKGGDNIWDNTDLVPQVQVKQMPEVTQISNQIQDSILTQCFQQQKQLHNQFNNFLQQNLSNDENRKQLNENEFEKLNYLLNELRNKIHGLNDNLKLSYLENLENLLLHILSENISMNLLNINLDTQNLNNELQSQNMNQKSIMSQDFGFVKQNEARPESQNNLDESEQCNNKQNQLQQEQNNLSLSQQQNQNDKLQEKSLLQKQELKNQLNEKKQLGNELRKQMLNFEEADTLGLESTYLLEKEEQELTYTKNDKVVENLLLNIDMNNSLSLKQIQENNEQKLKDVLEKQKEQLVNNDNPHKMLPQQLQKLYFQEEMKAREQEHLDLETDQLLFKNFSKDFNLQKKISQITTYHHDLNHDSNYVIFCSGHSFLFYLADYLKQEGYNIVTAYLDYSWLFPEVQEYLKKHCDVAVPLRHQLDDVLKKRGWPNLKGGNKAWHSRELEFAVDDFLHSSGAIEILPYHEHTSENLIIYRDKRETGFTCPLFGYIDMTNYIPEEVYSFEKLEGLKDICETHYLMPIKGMKYSSLRNKTELEYLFKESYNSYSSLGKIWQEILELDLTIEGKSRSFGNYSTLLDLHYEFEGRILDMEIDEYVEVPSGKKITLLEKRLQTIEKAIEEQNWLWTLNHREKERWTVVKPLGFSKSGKRVKVIGIHGGESFLPITNLYQRPSENYFGIM